MPVLGGQVLLYGRLSCVIRAFVVSVGFLVYRLSIGVKGGSGVTSNKSNQQGHFYAWFLCVSRCAFNTKKPRIKTPVICNVRP